MRVVIAGDSVLLRDGLVRLLAEDGHEVVAVAGDAAEFAAAVDRERPDVVVTDVRMPPTHTDEGIRAAVELRQRHPQLPVLVLSHTSRSAGRASSSQAGQPAASATC